MSWFKENKFLGGLIVITLILAGVIIYLGMGFQSTLDEKISEIETKEGSLKDMKGLDPYPTPESSKAKAESLKALITDANKMQAQFLAFKPESTAPIAVNEFSALLKDTHAKIEALFEGKITYPESFYLGFETYKAVLPTPASTGELAYELAAIEWLMTQMEAAKVTEVNNIIRHQIPSEKGETWESANAPAAGGRSRGGSRNRSRANSGPSLPQVANRMPIELVFKGPESGLRQVLSAIADSDQFFFDTRIARIKNESPLPTKPRTRGGEAAEAPKEESDEGFGALNTEPADDPADAPVGARRKVLDRVAGGDDVTAYLRVDLLLFTDGQQFPVIK